MKEMLSARERLVELLYEEVVGPGSAETMDNGKPCSIPDKETEVITDLPERRYYVGVLYPAGDKMGVDNDTPNPDPGGVEDDEYVEEPTADPEDDDRKLIVPISDPSDDTMDETMALSTQDKPSSVGMTFAIDVDVRTVTVDISFATYRPTTIEDCAAPYTGSFSAEEIEKSGLGQIVFLDGGVLRLKRPFHKGEVAALRHQLPDDHQELIDALYKLAAQCRRGYGFRRMPHKDRLELPLDGTPFKGVCSVPFACLRAIKNKIGQNQWTVTIMFYNGARGSYSGENTIFQPRIEVSSGSNPRFAVRPYDDHLRFSHDEEEQSFALLYRNRPRYGSGHGIAANWCVTGHSWKIFTDLMPISSIPQMDFDYAFKQGLHRKDLSLKYLSDLPGSPREERLAALERLIAAYDAWIDTIKRVPVTPDLKVVAERHISMCDEASTRMKSGIECLRRDSSAMRAFELANRAMFMQMKHRDIVQNMPDDEDPTEISYETIDYAHLDNDFDIYVWRPFQIAFFLMNIRGLTATEPDSAAQDKLEREIVDIIWFPTGGGKTEAYLALTAFTIFYRRLRYPDTSPGTTVMMRYTLRLLTSQQFSRASTLICACDMIRKDLWKQSGKRNKQWYTPISIGLWIGGEHTPNRNSSSREPMGAKEYLRKLTDSDKEDLEYRNSQYNRFQVLVCPWCGASLVPLPRPGKSEQWGYHIDDRNHFYLCCLRPGCPFSNKLPIQVVDEELYLHPPTLLLATVDKFAMLAWNKDVGSFFAIGSHNRTPELIIQDELHLISGPLGSIVGLYEAAIDSLCSAKGIHPKIIGSTATIRRADEQCWQLYNRPARQFPPPGIDQQNSFFAREDSDIDKQGRMYVGLFPSGKTKAMLQTKAMSTLLQYVSMLQSSDHVKDKYWTLTGYFSSLRDLGKCAGLVDDDIKDSMKRLCRRIASDRTIRPISVADELTSRVSTTTLVKRLKQLEKVTYSRENQAAKNYAINVLLATSMISVGVDVDRLNLMLVVGQPKLTSEYIQATSRVGRRYPGLVCVLYNATKSRDRSHYEQFHAYHQSFYRYVEPTSVTPYSQPALDRALHAVIVAIVRQMDSTLRDDRDASNFDRGLPLLAKMKRELLERMDSAHSHAYPDQHFDTDAVAAQIDALLDDWASRVEGLSEADTLYYGLRFMMTHPGPNEHRLLRPFGVWEYERSRETLTSMRNVDQSLSASMLIWE